MTEVRDLDTDKVYCYSLGPQEALKNCYLQIVQRDFNTWDYDKKEVPEFVKVGIMLVCADRLATKEASQ